MPDVTVLFFVLDLYTCDYICIYCVIRIYIVFYLPGVEPRMGLSIMFILSHAFSHADANALLRECKNFFSPNASDGR